MNYSDFLKSLMKDCEKQLTGKEVEENEKLKGFLEGCVFAYKQAVDSYSGKNNGV